MREGPSKGFDGFGPMVGFNEKGRSPLEPISDGLVCEPLEVRKGPSLDGIGPQVGSPIEPNSSHKQVTIKEVFGLLEVQFGKTGRWRSSRQI